jgi:hypothetical protein
MKEDIENCSLMSNYRDCRPEHSSLFSNHSLADKTSKKKLTTNPNSLSITKTLQERENSKRQI